MQTRWLGVTLGMLFSCAFALALPHAPIATGQDVAVPRGVEDRGADDVPAKRAKVGVEKADLDVFLLPDAEGNLRKLLNVTWEEFRKRWEEGARGIEEPEFGLDRFHGNLAVAKSALEQGFLPDYISTDLATPNLHHIVYDLPTTVSKFVALGLPLVEALAKCTYAPAAKIGRENEIGCNREGGIADVAIFDVVTQDHVFEDFFENTFKAKERMLPFMTIRKGEILEPNPRTTETLDCVFKGTSPWHLDN